MYDFSIQVLATLVSSLIIFCITRLIKIIKKLSISFWFNLVYNITFFATYLFNVNNLVTHLKIIIKATKVNYFKYIIFLISLSLCIYTIVDSSAFIKDYFFQNRFKK